MGHGCGMNARYDLERFVAAQAPVYHKALEELRAGKKRSHWMWFIFPQIEGLGHSQTAAYYGISGKDEASAYMAHPVLGPRLVECSRAVLDNADKGVQAIFGHPDDLKFHSSITLFSRAKPTDPVFAEALERFDGGVGCQRTLEKLRRALIDSLD